MNRIDGFLSRLAQRYWPTAIVLVPAVRAANGTYYDYDLQRWIEPSAKTMTQQLKSEEE